MFTASAKFGSDVFEVMAKTEEEARFAILNDIYGDRKTVYNQKITIEICNCETGETTFEQETI